MTALTRTRLPTAPAPTLIRLPKITTANTLFETRPEIPEEQHYYESLPPLLQQRPPGVFLPPVEPGGDPWAPCICQLCSCGQHHCPDVTPIPPPNSEYGDKFTDKKGEPPIVVYPEPNNWWPDAMPNDLRLQTLYRRNYRDWKMRPNHVHSKDVYVPPFAEFKTDSEYQAYFKFPYPIEDLAEKYKPQSEIEFLKLKGPLKSVYGWDYVDFPPGWKKAGEPQSARFLQNKIWHRPFHLGYKTARPFNGISTYTHDYVWFDEFGVAHPYPPPHPFNTPAWVPEHYVPMPLQKADFPHWKGVVPPESWKPNIPYSPPPFPLVKKTTYNTSYKDFTNCGPDGVGRDKVPVVCMDCPNEISMHPEWISTSHMDYHEHDPLWFCDNIKCLTEREDDPCRDVMKEKCIDLCDKKAAHKEFLQTQLPPSAFDPTNPFRPKPRASDGPDPIRSLVYQPCDPWKHRVIPCAAEAILVGMSNAKSIGRTSCPETGHVYVCPNDVEKIMREELRICTRYPFRTWSKGDLEVETMKEEKFKIMEATGGTRK